MIFSNGCFWFPMVPLKGGIGGIVHPPIGRKNTTYIPLIYILPSGGLYATYHLLGEPETTIDFLGQGVLTATVLTKNKCHSTLGFFWWSKIREINGKRRVFRHQSHHPLVITYYSSPQSWFSGNMWKTGPWKMS